MPMKNEAEAETLPDQPGRTMARLALAVWLLLFGAFLIWGAATAANAQESDAAAQAEAAKATIDIRDGWTRATPGNATSAAVYLDIVNSGKEADTLTGVISPNAQHAAIHATTTANGTAQMNMTPSLAIPAGATVSLAPNGRHVMLEGLKAPLREGDSFIITLNFAKAGKVSATVKVMGVAAMGPTAAR